MSVYVILYRTKKLQIRGVLDPFGNELAEFYDKDEAVEYMENDSFVRQPDEDEDDPTQYQIVKLDKPKL